ncbi:fatty acyl-CoA reductase 2, chloroplastic-like [Lycium ferocissimum]|uniref:fatty acyl-CoA reductase 2, chloroplastic-like n=1 Tax=Lycium ferocissimum TaxID=112874 RepID=UPI0028161B79|nr:fatty acyl-CoA reductase 2, chloroplastic-like [Lycium ferocissimum]
MTAFDPEILDFAPRKFIVGSATAFIRADLQYYLIPVDMVVNATVQAAIAKHGYLQNPELNVYNVASTSVNPVSLSQIFDYSYDFFQLFSFVNSKGEEVEVRKMRFFDKMSDFSNYILEELSRQHRVQDLSEDELAKIQKRCKRKVDYLKHFSKLYEAYLCYKGWFHNGNVRKLMKDMSEEEKTSFEIDVTKINWRNYFVKTHIPGVQKHVLEGGGYIINVETIKYT